MRSVSSWLERLWNGIVDTAENIQSRAGDAITLWAEDGWLVHPLVDALVVLQPFAAYELLSRGAITRDPALVLDLFDKFTGALVRLAVERLGAVASDDHLPERMESLGDLLWAYESARYSLVPGAAYALAEGAVRDATGGDLDALFSTVSKRRAQAEAALSFHPQGPWDAPSKYKLDQHRSLLASLDLLSEPSSAPQVTRHRIMHGGTGIASKTESVRALLFLFAVLAVKADS